MSAFVILWLVAQQPAPQESPGDPFPGGVASDRISPAARYSLSGRDCDRQKAFEAVEGNDLMDDSKRPRLTVIGTRDERTRILADIQASGIAGDYAVKGYDPSHWIVRDAGFVTTGKPTIYLQRSDGKVLHRQDEFEGGVDALAGAVRKADPTYDPAKDPDLRKAAPTPAEPPNVMPKIPGLPSPWDYLLGLLIFTVIPVLFRDRLQSGGGSLLVRLRDLLMGPKKT